MAFDVTRHDLVQHPIFSQVDFIKNFINQHGNYGFKHFSYLRLIDKQQRILLTSNPELSDTFIKKKLYKVAFYGPPEVYSNGLFLIEHLKLEQLRPVMSECGVRIGFVIIKKHPHFVEQFCWGSTENNPALYHFVINNLDVFENAGRHFLDYAKPLLKQYERVPLLYPEGLETSGLEAQSLSAIKKNILSAREQEVLYYLKQGLSSKKIAYALDASHRTIDKHIENMLCKTNSGSRLELINKLAYLD